jgi:hypothetical protein
LIALSFEGLTQQSLAVTRAIVGSRVEEIDAQLTRALDAAQRLSIIDLAPACGPSI